MNGFDGVNHPTGGLREYKTTTVQPKRKKLKWFLFFALIIVVAAVGFGGYKLFSNASKIFTGKKSIFTRVGSLFISSSKPLIGEDKGIVNVLLLGIGGEGHDGANLTDTMIVASINVKTNEVVLTSIPRDWFMPIEGHGLNKINAVYAYALKDHPNDYDVAGHAAISAVEKVTGFTIPYYALVDFKGFVKAIDHVDGLDITVDRTFSDSTFPNDYPYDTKGYLGTVTFNKGTQHMDGRTALIFARSRHGTNDEGSDFARSERQKKVMVALKGKLLDLGITNLNTLNKLMSDFTGNFKTNLEPYELLRLANISKQINGDNVYSLSLEPQGNLICATTIDQLTGKPYIHPVEEDTTTPDSTTTPTSTNSTSTKSTTSTNTTKDTSTSGKTSSSTKASTTPSPTPTPTSPDAPPSQIPMYIVEPCLGKTTADIQKYLSDYWDQARLKKEGAVIEIQNSTGLASASAQYKNLAESGLTVNFVTFFGKVAFNRTILYDDSHGTKPRTLDYLKNHFDFTTADVQYTNSKADFVIIIGSQ